MALIDELNFTINVDQERLKKIETDMKKLAAATNEVKDNIKGLQSAISNLGAALEKSSPKRHTRAQKELAKQTKDTADAIKKEVKEAKELGKASEAAAKAKEKSAKASLKQADAEDKAAKKAKKAKVETTGLIGAMKRLGDTVLPVVGLRFKDVDKKAATLFTTLTNLKKKLDSFRVASTFGTVGAVVAGLGGVLLEGGWRQSALNTAVKQNVYGYGGYTGPMTEQIVAAARDLGLKYRSVDANQIANAVGEMMHPRLGRLGYSVDEVKKLTSLILNITGATGTDAGYLAKALSLALGEYNIKPSGAETAIMQMFDVARKTGVPMLEVAHYMNDMASVARRTGMGYAEMLTRGGQAWYAGADASLVYGAIHREAQALTDEYKGRFQESIETLRTSDTTDRRFQQAWYNLFQKKFPGLTDHPEVVDFLQALRTKQLWSHDMESLVLDFASRQGYGLPELYAGEQTYRAQVDRLLTDVFTNPNPSILSRFSDAELDAFNLLRDKLPESAEALSHLDVNVDSITAMRKDTESAWDRMVREIKEFFNPLLNWVGGIFLHLVPKASQGDILRERLADEAGIPWDDRKASGFYVNPNATGAAKAATDARIEKYLMEHPYATAELTDAPWPIKTLLGWSRVHLDPLGKLVSNAMEDSANTALYGVTPPPTPIEGVPPLGVGSTGTPQVNIEHLTIAQNVNSLAETQHNVAELSRAFAYGTGD